MLYLVTGTPGSGKTLNTIKFLNEDSRFQQIGEGDNKESRQIYYHGIKNLNPDFGWIELDQDQAVKWFDLPPKSVIVFDEAYTIFPVRHGSKVPPDHVQRLATHRHHGYDIVMICQKVTGQLDPFIRGLVGQHRHYARIMGSKNVNCYVWDNCQDNPNTTSAKQMANVSPTRLDKKYFGAYHSADEHTHKLNLPWGRITVLILTVVFLGVIVIAGINRFQDRQASFGVNKQGENSTEQSSFISQSPRSTRASSTDSFIDRFNPEIPGLPWSAPVYSDVTQAKTWPRPAACIEWTDTKEVLCYTQQGTKIYIPDDMARQIIKEGFFDWTKDENSEQQTAKWGTGAGETHVTPEAVPQFALVDDTAADPIPRQRRRVKIIDHTPEPRMKLSGSERPTSAPVYELVPRG